MVLGYHIEEVTDLCSFGQVPHVDIPVVAGRQQDAGVEWVSLHDKHLVIVALGKCASLSLHVRILSNPEPSQRYKHFGHSRITHGAAAQWSISTL